MTAPPDLMAALQAASAGGAAPQGPGPAAAPAPDPSGAGLPPELMNAINNDAQTLDPSQPNPGQQGPQQQGGDPVDFLRAALDALDSYKGVEQDQIDLAEAAKIYALIQKLLAKDQQEREAAAGVTPAHKGMAKAYGVGPAAGAVAP
jgi:hypothetical protein